MKKQRKHYTPEEKVAILRRHLLEKEPISNLCEPSGSLRNVLGISSFSRLVLSAATAPQPVLVALTNLGIGLA